MQKRNNYYGNELFVFSLIVGFLPPEVFALRD